VPLPFLLALRSVSNHAKTRFPHPQLMDILRLPCSSSGPNAQNEITFMITLDVPPFISHIPSQPYCQRVIVRQAGQRGIWSKESHFEFLLAPFRSAKLKWGSGKFSGGSGLVEKAPGTKGRWSSDQYCQRWVMRSRAFITTRLLYGQQNVSRSPSVRAVEIPRTLLRLAYKVASANLSLSN
jgi:hypothetical protein